MRTQQGLEDWFCTTYLYIIKCRMNIIWIWNAFDKINLIKWLGIFNSRVYFCAYYLIYLDMNVFYLFLLDINSLRLKLIQPLKDNSQLCFNNKCMHMWIQNRFLNYNYQALWVCEQQFLQEELEHLDTAFCCNSYFPEEIMSVPLV